MYLLPLITEEDRKLLRVEFAWSLDTEVDNLIIGQY